jgi:hypothetical protein
MASKGALLVVALVLFFVVAYLLGIHSYLYRLAIMSHDKPIIGELADGGFKDPSACDKVWDSEVKDMCIFQVGVKTNSPAVCGKIEYQKERDDCYLNVGVALKSTLGCDKIVDSDVGGYCRALAKKDANYCDKIRQVSYRNRCYLEIAKSKNDAQICDRIADQDNPKTGYKAECYAALGKS